MAIVRCVVQSRPADLVALGAQEFQWDLERCRDGHPKNGGELRATVRLEGNCE